MMKNKWSRILVCGQRPKSKMTGVALAVELLLEGLSLESIRHVAIDSTFFNQNFKAGTFSIIRAIETLLVICGVWLRLPFCQIYYATMSTSPVGFIRDYLTVGFAKLLGRRTVLHLHGGGFEDFYTSQKPWLQCLIRSNLKRTDTIVVLGELLKEQFYCAGEFVEPKLVVVANGLTLGVDEPVAEGKELTDDKRIELNFQLRFVELS